MPACTNDGRCVECVSHIDCSAKVNTPACDPATSKCTPCSADDQCTHFCDRTTGRCATNAEILFVDAAGPSCPSPGPGEGTNVDPYCEISSALNNLGLRRYVYVKAGSYSTAAAVGVSFRLRAEAETVIHTPDPLKTGLSISGSTSQVEVDGLRVTGPGGDKPGISVSGMATVSLRRVRVDDAGYYAISCQSSTLTMDAVEVTGSTRGGVELSNCTFGIINTVIARNGGEFGGVRITNPGSASYFVNNTVVFNSGGGSIPGGIHCVSPAVIVNSVISANTPTDVGATCSLTFSITGQAIPGQGNLMQDPVFVDAASGNYRLQAGSYGIDQGTGSSANVGE